METANLELNVAECPVCHEYYKEPKILPCAHLLCHDCLSSWTRVKDNAQCPICRCAIVGPHNPEIKSSKELANQLPTDDVMSEMVENMKIFHQKRVCHVHSDMKAKSFCLHCGLMLCTMCAEAHIKIPAISFHKLEDVETLTLESLNSCRQSPCSTHPDKTSELYCVMHDVLICNVCALSNHRACPEVPFLNGMVETNRRSLSEMEKRLSAVESALSHVMAEIEKLSVGIEQNTKDSLILIDAACDRLVMSIENCRKRLKKLVQDVHDNTMAGVYKQKDSLGHRRGLITSHRSLIHRIQLSASCASLTTMVPRLNKRVSDLDLNATLLSDRKLLTPAKLTIDERAVSHIEMELARLGQLNVSSARAEEQTVWQFHVSHNIKIVHCWTAELKGNFSGNLLSRKPMKANMLYEIRVEETDKRFDGSDFGFGLVTEDPVAITHLPWPSSGLQSAIVVFGDGIFVKKQRTRHNCGVAYKTFKVGSRIGVVVDAARCLHIYVDGKDQGVVYRDVQLPCWALFDLSCSVRKVTVLPLTIVP